MSEEKKSTTAEVTEAKWVSSMHAHFHDTRTYRATDLHKVIGDVRQGVAMPTCEKSKLGQSMLRK